MIDRLIFVGLLVFSAAVARAQPSKVEDPRDPPAVIEFFMQTRPGWPGQYDHIKARIQRAPDQYAPLLAEILALPETWDPNAPSTSDRARRILSVHAHGLLRWIGRERAEPLIRREFMSAARLFREAEANRCRAEKEAQVVKMQGRPREDDTTKLRRGSDQMSGLMGSAVASAEDLDSPVLVDPVLELLETGVCWRRDATRYLLKFTAAQQEVIPRLKRIAADPKTCEQVKSQIDDALRHSRAAVSSAAHEAAHGK